MLCTFIDGYGEAFCFNICVLKCFAREKIGYYESVNIINPEDAAILFKAEGHYPKRLRVEPWTSYRDYRNRKYGVLLKYDSSLNDGGCI